MTIHQRGESMSVVLDSIEPSHIKDLFHEFYPEGSVERLDSADLACTEYNVGIERKTAPDFVGSVMGSNGEDGRLWHQARRMRDTYASSYIILVGGYDDLSRQDKLRFSEAMWKGAIISLMARYNMKFLKVQSNREFFEVSKRIFSKSDGIDTHPMNVKRATNEKEAVLVGALYQVPGIGLEYSKRIIGELGVDNIPELCTISKEDLMSVDGIGERKATAIKEYYFER
jgi:ERCC4-type nuclease